MEIRWMLLVMAALAMPAAGADCGGLARLNLLATSINVAEEVTAGAFQPPGARTERPARVLSRSRHNPAFERFGHPLWVWMPLTGWNSKFQGIGTADL
jgi:hypothetical protein